MSALAKALISTQSDVFHGFWTTTPTAAQQPKVDEFEIARAILEARAAANRVVGIAQSQTAARTSVRSGDRLIVMKDWEGVVEEVGPDSFVARLRDRSALSEFDSEAAEIPTAEVAEDDLPLLLPGAIFYLTVYRRVLQSGRHERTTRLIFRRLPAWTPSRLRSVESRANRWINSFGVGESNSAVTG